MDSGGSLTYLLAEQHCGYLRMLVLFRASRISADADENIADADENIEDADGTITDI